MVNIAACNQEQSNAKKSDLPLTEKQSKALAAFIDHDFVFTDTLIHFEIKADQLVLDFGETEEKSWNLTALWRKDGRDVCNSDFMKNYFLDQDKKAYLNLPAEYKNYKDGELELTLGAIPTRTSYISNWDKYNAQLTSFLYEDTGQNSLRPIREHWLQMLHITHRVNNFDFDDYPYEMVEFLVGKEQEIIKNLKFIKPQ